MTTTTFLLDYDHVLDYNHNNLLTWFNSYHFSSPLSCTLLSTVACSKPLLALVTLLPFGLLGWQLFFFWMLTIRFQQLNNFFFYFYFFFFPIPFVTAYGSHIPFPALFTSPTIFFHFPNIFPHLAYIHVTVNYQIRGTQSSLQQQQQKQVSRKRRKTNQR